MQRHGSMNHIYRLVWSTVANCWVAVAENTRGRGEGTRRKLVAAALSVGSLAAQAGPTGGQVTAGSGNIAQSGATTTVTQASQNLSIDWSSFNIAPQETVNFVQPSATAIAVNRIFDPNGSQILGHLNANGQIFLINPNGILFGAGAQVNVGGLVASTLDWNGTTGNAASFSGNGTGSVLNLGTIKTANGGYAAFLGNHVGNQGIVTARLGTVALGAGNAVTLTFNGPGLVSVQVNRNLLNALAENGGLIRADGGQVIMTAGARDALLASVVNNSGTIEARTANSHTGYITLLGGMTSGTVNVGGTLDAGAPIGGYGGGFIETSAAHVKIGDGATVTTIAANGKNGTWLVDPTNFTISAGSAAQTGSGMGATTLEAALAGGNVSIATSSAANGSDLGDINVNAPVTWSVNKLALTAANDVNINSVMTLNNAAALDLEPGSGKVNIGMNASGNFLGQVNFLQADGVTPRGGTGFLTINNNPYTVITSLGVAADATSAPAIATLQGIAATSNLSGHFALGSNIGASLTASWSGNFTPIGNGSVGFSGIFDGLGHTIGNLTVSRPTLNYNGLFGYGYGSVRNVGLAGASISGGGYTGGLLGYNIGSVTNSYVQGHISGGMSTGGLVGANGAGGSTSNSYVTGSVSGASYTGGLIGRNFGTITNSYETSSVNSGSYTGGLVGYNSGSSSGGIISNSYATGNVNGSSGVAVGGLVGRNSGTIANSYYTTGTVSGTDNTMGGLVGANYGTVSNSYSTGNVNGRQFTGGLVGGNSSTGSVTSSYATGSVSGSNYVGGLAGQNYGSINNSYAIGSASGTQYVGGLLGQNAGATAAVNHSFSSGGVTVTGSVTVSGSGGLIGISKNGATTTNSFWDTTTSGQSTSAGGTGMSTAQMQTQANFTSATAPNGNANPAWDFSSTWVMYDGHTYPLLRSFMTNLTVSTVTASKTYDAAAYSDPFGVNYSITPNGNLLGTGALAFTAGGQPIVNAGTYSNVMASGLYSNQQGYIIAYAPGTVTINKAPLSVSGESASKKVYDATNTATLSGGALVGVAGGDAITLNQAGTFGSVNVGNGIAVTANDSLSGAAAGNYTLTQPSGLVANITPASLVVTGISAGNKVYDSTTSVALSGTPAVAALGSDVVTVGGTGVGAFADPNAGNGKPVTISGYVLGGAGAGNYSIVQPVGVTANIAPATLTVTGESAANKVYDTTTTATLSGGSLVGVRGSDTITLNQAGSFATKNAGSGIVVVASDSVSGAAAGNYVLTQPSGLSANITPANVTLTGVAVASKTYDGTVNATLSGTPTVVALGSDALTISGAGFGAFADPNVGSNKPVTVSGYTLGGSSAGNYTLTQATGVTGNITPASLSVTGETAANKVYDSSTAATLKGGVLIGVIGNDVVTLNQSGIFVSKNAGNGIAVTAADTISGAASGNYTLVQPKGLSANITPANLTVSGEIAANKVYDGTTAATVSGGKLVGVYSGDNVTLTEGGTFTAKNVGIGIVLAAADSIGGSAASNYVLIQPGGLKANINPATLTVSGETAANKVYDGTTTAALSGGKLVGVIGNDSVTLAQAGNFASKNAGIGVGVTATDALGGAAAGNYVLTQPTGLTAAITPATLTYDAAPITLLTGQQAVGLTGSVTGFVPGDSLTGSTSGTATWTTTAGTNSAAGFYPIDGSGLLSSNYMFVQAGANADALTLKASTAPTLARNVTAALDANLPSSQSSTQPATQNSFPSTLVTQILNTDSAAIGDSSTPNDGTEPSGPINVGSSDPILRIVSSGIKLPYDSLNLNDYPAILSISMNKVSP